MTAQLSYMPLSSVIAEEDIGDPNMYAPDNVNPLGSNEGALWFNFDERLRYRNSTYFKGLPKPIDTFYDKVFYWKVDRYQNAIVPKQDSSLIAQTSYDENVFALDFVAQAFFKLKRNLKIAGDSGGIDKNSSVLCDLNAVRGWFNYERSYRSVFQRVIDGYHTYLTSQLARKEFNQITTFADYMNALVSYRKTNQSQLPFSLTEFVLFPATPASISGLVVEIGEDSYSEDLNKYQKYFLDPNFSYYVRAARKFGFYVDKNGPWRLFADIFSTPMVGPEGFITETNKVPGDIEKNFFNSYYDRTYTLDVQLFKTLLRESYNHFVSINPKITETVTGLTRRGVNGAGVGSIRCGAPSSISILGYRQPVTAADVDALGDPFWLAFYFNTRMQESGVYYKNATTLIQEAHRVAYAYDFNQALIYINNLFKPYIYDERLFKKHLTRGDTTVRLGSSLDVPTISVGAGTGNY